jgi:hypothetical protein
MRTQPVNLWKIHAHMPAVKDRHRPKSSTVPRSYD